MVLVSVAPARFGPLRRLGRRLCGGLRRRRRHRRRARDRLLCGRRRRGRSRRRLRHRGRLRLWLRCGPRGMRRRRSGARGHGSNGGAVMRSGHVRPRALRGDPVARGRLPYRLDRNLGTGRRREPDDRGRPRRRLERGAPQIPRGRRRKDESSQTDGVRRDAHGASIQGRPDGPSSTLPRGFDRNRVPALALRAVERDIGAPEKLVARLAGRELSDAEAGRDGAASLRSRAQRAQ